MANKKKSELVVEVEPQTETVAPEVGVVGYTTPVNIEPLLKVKSRGRFIDGNLTKDFAKYGYPVNWPDSSIRNIPAWLYKKCLDSGGRFDLEA